MWKCSPPSRGGGEDGGEVVLGEKSLRKQGKVQFLILYSKNKMLFFQTFFVNNFLTNNERGLKLIGGIVLH